MPELRNSVRAAEPVFQQVYFALAQAGLAQELDRQACPVLVQAARVESAQVQVESAPGSDRQASPVPVPAW